MHRNFSPLTLARIQRIKNAYLVDRAHIETETGETDARGASTHVWQMVATNVPCRLITQGQSNNAARNIASQEGLVETYRFALKLDSVTLAVNMRLTVNDAVYQIVDILAHRTDQDELQVTAKRDIR